MVIGANQEEQLAPFNKTPNLKFDWCILGGRASGLIKLKESVTGNVGGGCLVMHNEAKKGDITNFDEIITFALLKDGEWFEKGKMGWWNVVQDKKDDERWKNEFKNLVQGLPDDTLISIFDCHI